MTATTLDEFLDTASAREIVNAQLKLSKKIGDLQRQAIVSLLKLLNQDENWNLQQPTDLKSARLTSITNYEWNEAGQIVEDIGNILDPAGFSFDVHCIRPRSSAEDGACIQIVITPLPGAFYFYYEDGHYDGVDMLDLTNALAAIEGIEELKDQ